MRNYLAGYGQEIVEYDEDYDEEDIDDILDALSGEEEDWEALGQVPTAPRRVPGRAKAFVRPVSPRQFRKYPLGLGVTAIAAGTTAVINVNPQLPFKLQRISCESVAAAGLVIDNIQIGTVSQFVAAGAIPVEVFAPDATGVELKGDTAVPGVAIQITVTNPTAGALNFTGALLGLVAQ